MPLGYAITCTKGIWTLDSGQTPVPTASQTPVPTASLAPVPTASAQAGFDSDGIATAANNDVQRILASAPNPKSTYIIHQSANVSQPLVDIANSVFPTAVKFWEPVYAPTKPADIIMGYWSDGTWLQETDKQAGDTPGGYGSLADWTAGHPASDWPSVSGSGSHQGTSVNGVIPKIIIIVSGPEVISRPGAYTTPTHEYTMNVMQELDPNVFQQSPCWFNEGMAQFYGATLTYSNQATYLQNRRTMLLDHEFGAYPFTAQKSDAEWAALVAADAPSNCGGSGGPWLGQLAVEKMVALKGTAGIIAFLKDLNIGGSFNASFNKIYGMTTTEFYALTSSHISSTVADLLGLPQPTPAVTAVISNAGTSSVSGALSPATMQANILKEVDAAIAASKNVPTSTLITLNVQPGALTDVQAKWINDALQFISYLSPPTNGGKWNLVFPTTMDWFLKNWDMSLESQHYKDMFANNTAEQLMASVHSHGTSDGGWDASFFVSPKVNWFNSDWQMRFIAQLLKPAGFADGSLGQTIPDWFTRPFAYPIGAAYSQETSSGSYSAIRQGWLSTLQQVSRPFNMSFFENASSNTGPETYKMPGALADEILISKSGISKLLNFIKDTQASGGNWSNQLVTSFGITKADLYAQISSLVSP